MNKTELTAVYAEATGQAKVVAGEQLERLFNVIAAELGQGGEVALPQIGKLKTVKRAARKGRNPRTGAEISIPARCAITFAVNEHLKQALN